MAKENIESGNNALRDGNEFVAFLDDATVTYDLDGIFSNTDRKKIAEFMSGITAKLDPDDQARMLDALKQRRTICAEVISRLSDLRNQRVELLGEYLDREIDEPARALDRSLSKRLGNYTFAVTMLSARLKENAIAKGANP